MADEASDSLATASTRFQCTRCDRSFAHREHLTRHAATHESSGGGYKCPVCFKEFVRSDVLRRHAATHSASANGRKLKSIRSCVACVVAKTRCSANIPCSRCLSRRIDCHPNVISTPRSSSRASKSSMPSSEVPSSAVLSPRSDAWPSPTASVPLPPRRSARDQVGDILAPSFDALHSTDHQQLSIARAITDDNRSLTDEPLALAEQDRQPPIVNADAQGCSPSRLEVDFFSLAPIPKSRELYLNSHGARLPKIRRTNTTHNYQSRPARPSNDQEPMAFPSSRPLTPDLEDASLRTRSFIQQETWEEIKSRFEQYCLTPSALFPSFATVQFPCRQDLDIMIAGYFDSFQQILPVVHFSSLDLSRSAWLLAVALAAIGSHYIGGASKYRYIEAMHEFLQRALIFTAEDSNGQADNSITTAKLLHSVGLMFSGNTKLLSKARRWRPDLVLAYHSLCREACRHFALPTARDDYTTLTSWLEWANLEHHRRLAYGIWMIDCMWSYLLGENTFLPVSMPTIPLPCAEVVWDATSAKQWREVIEFADTTPTLDHATERIFAAREVQTTLGEYSRVLLIHGLYHHMWHIKALTNTKVHWAPSGDFQAVIDDLPWHIWPPTSASYQKWREAVCDCLDTLHWRANSVIGASSGLEHPTVAHLHLARVVLLSPYSDIRDFARALLQGDNTKCVDLAEKVRSWICQDCYKARLTMIHAGVTFWHLRRFSVGAFYELHAVVLAALALWAFAIFAERSVATAISPETPGTTASGSHNPLPASINLDRPCDDELVQSFIQEGTRIPAMIGGVGEICTPQGPARILEQAMDILQTFNNWGITTEASAFLADLSQVDLSEFFPQSALMHS